MLLFFSILLISSCSGVKNVTYFQKIGTQTDSLKQSQPTGVHTATIKPMDLLSITVVTTVPETSRIYNLTTPQIMDNSSNNGITSMPTLQTYLVDEDGNIDFPVFGKLTVKGMTRKELVMLLQDKLVTAFSERPIVTIRITNFSVNIVGEVLRPGRFIITNERLTIIDGLAMAGDMTIYGQRDRVKVLREDADGTKKFMTINLNDENSIYSPAYYLEQNDVVYVEPNKVKSRTSKIGAAETLSVSALSLIISVASIVINVLK
jgi:polysaccharide biosynthesis/export protein